MQMPSRDSSVSRCLLAGKLERKPAQLPCQLPRGWQVSHQKWIREHVRVCPPLPAWIRLPTMALKPRPDITRSPKQGYQWSHKKDLCPPKILKKKRISMQMGPSPIQPDKQTDRNVKTRICCHATQKIMVWIAVCFLLRVNNPWMMMPHRHNVNVCIEWTE